MSGIIAKSSETSFEIVPSGNYVARCYAMIEIGTIFDEMFQVNRKLVRVSWELPFKKKVFNPEKGEQPYSMHKEYTLSMSDKANLRHDLESWRGKGFTEQEAKAFDITKLLGVPCMLNVIHKTSAKGKTYATISSITPIPEGMTCPPQINETFMLSYAEWSETKFVGLPDWIKEKMQTTPEFQAILSGGSEVPVDDKPNDDLPF